MSKFGKFKAIFGSVEPMVKPFLPGAAGTVLDMVNNHLTSSKYTPLPEGTLDAVRALAMDNDEQTAAILAVHQRQDDLDVRLKALEGK